MTEPTAEQDAIARQVVDAAFMVHSTLGPGLLESVYADCLAIELDYRGIPLAREVKLPVFYRGRRLEAGFRMDFVVADAVVIEVKAVETLLPIHATQLLTYLKLSQHQVGFLINFNVKLIKQGIRRLIRSP